MALPEQVNKTGIFTISEFSHPYKVLSSDNDDVQFSSDNIEVDEKNKIVTALGNVIIINNSRKSGIIEKRRNLSKNSTPLTPLSITLLNAPVFRDKW